MSTSNNYDHVLTPKQTCTHTRARRAHTRAPRGREARGKINILSKTTSLNDRCVSTTSLRQPKRRISQTDRTESHLICYGTKCYFPYQVRGQLNREGTCIAVPLRSIGWLGRAAAWRRSSTPARSLPCDSCTLLPRERTLVLTESWAHALPPLTLTRRWVQRPVPLPLSGALCRNTS